MKEMKKKNESTKKNPQRKYSLSVQEYNMSS